ncbi:MAG: SurA N-terminal domain-containing protein [Burkholderiales bacterium]|nr:SurA N-terminal domain-containing protein [Burkholderiales bacterium]
MFDFVYRNKRLVQIILALLVLPFALVGIDSYVRGTTADNHLALVDGQPISPAEFDQALRNQQEQMRQLLGSGFDAKMFDSPEVRQQVLDGLINQRVLQARTQQLRLTATDSQLQQVIRDQPVFQEGGQFSLARYDEVLRANGFTRLSYEARLRQELAQQALSESLMRGGIVGATQAALFQRLTEQSREVQVAILDPSAFLAQAKVDEAAVRAEYDRSPDSYRSPEQVRLEYVIFSQAQLAAAVTVPEAELRAQYESRRKEFALPEERRASHILLVWEKDAQGKPKPESKALIRQEAETLARELAKADAASFAAAARQKSKDPGSAAQGGDLGFFPRGQMVKPFEEAVFSMKPGEVQGPVETEFGYHVIRLTEIKPEQIKPFEAVRAQLEGELRQQKAAKLFAEGAEKFQNRVYEVPDSYRQIAEELKLEIKQTDWLTRAQVQALASGSAKFAEVVFSPASTSGKRNSEAIDLGHSALISARVLEHKPAAVRPFDEVKAEISAMLQRRAASELAAKEGAARLAALQAGGTVKLDFGTPQRLTRQGSLPGINAPLRRAVFAADLSRAPAYVGAVNDAGGYTIVRVNKAIEPAASDARKLGEDARRLAQQLNAELQQAYLAALKELIEVKVKPAGAALGKAAGEAKP